MNWTALSGIAIFGVLAAKASRHSLRTSGEKVSNHMKSRSYAGAVMLFASLLLVPAIRAQEQTSAASPPTQEAILQHMQELEKEVQSLRAEVAALKNTDKPEPAAAPAVPQNNLVSSASSSAPAAPSGPTLASLLGPTSVSGFVDVYFGRNFNNPSTQANGLRFFDGATQAFGLNMVELIVDKTPDAENSRTGYRVALGFGQAMNTVNSSEPRAGLGFDQYLKEAYFSYLAPVGKGLQIDVGKFVTPHGAEVIETKDNWNYSRGILFTYAIPYYHFGMRAKYTFNDKFWVSGDFVNGWNNVVDNNTGKTYGASFGWNPSKKFGIIQNYMAGPELSGDNSSWRQLSDTTIIISPTSKLTFMVNGDYGRGDRFFDEEGGASKPVYWTGVAGYVKYAFTGSTAFSTRYEYYNDHDGFTSGVPQHFHGITTTFEKVVASRIISRFEYRHDRSNRPYFLKGSDPVDYQNTLTAGLVFTFDSREGH